MKTKKFPKTIYVMQGQDGKEAYLNAFDEIPIEEGATPCAVYELKWVGRMKVERTLVK